MKNLITTIIFSCFAQITLAQFAYINPVPGSDLHYPQTNIILKNGSLIQPESVNDNSLLEISGSLSGAHTWKARLSDDGKSVVIKADPIFEYSETVYVTVHPVLKKITGETIEGTTFSFKTRPAISAEQETLYRQIRLQNFIESYGYDPTKKPNNQKLYPLDSMPTYVININNNPASGRIFYSNHEQQLTGEEGTNCFATIIENNGKIVWARDLGKDGHDFKLNNNGYLTYFSYDSIQWMVLDSNYNIIDSVQCKNGYELETETHDMMMYHDGHVFLMARDIQNIDMTAYGGSPNANVQGLIIQEQDANRDVVFEWRSWDHFLFTDANSHTSLTNAVVDYVHGNSVERDFDGNILISSRNMDELTKINHETGDIIWRMGGENNQFTFINDNIPEHFSSQHDLRRLPNGNITIFNNGNYLSPLISSAKEYSLDEVNKVATLVWYYEHPDVGPLHVFGAATGNAQRLPNGNTLINWGLISSNIGIPNCSEVTMNKNIVWEMTFDSFAQKSYRFHKYNWKPCSRITGYTMKAIPHPLKMTLSWGKATGAQSYDMQYRLLGNSTWTKVQTSKPKADVFNLIPGGSYEWRVRTICNSALHLKSAFSVTDTFIVGGLKEVNPDISSSELISIYPVPASDEINIHINGTGGQLITIVNTLGGKMYQQKIAIEEPQTITVNTHGWASGIYFVNIWREGDCQQMKFTKQ